jgi:heavy metal sensor kinase
MMKPSSANGILSPRKTAFWRTLRFRFALWVTALLLVAIALFGVLVYTNLRASLLAGIDDTLRLSATQSIATIDLENGQVNFADIPAGGSAADGAQERGLTIRILGPDGTPLEASGPYIHLPVGAASMTAASDGHTSMATVLDPTGSDRVRVYTEPIVENQQLVGVIQVAQSLGNMDDTLSRLVAAILLSAPLLIGLAGAGGYLLAARALTPIDRMTRTARRITAQDLSARIALPETDDEVGRLAATLDHMIRRLDTAFRRERQFTSDASHELRTPLAAMQAIISVTRQERRSPQDYEQALDDLAEETDRLRTLTENLLSLARGDAKEALALERVDLSTLLADLCDSLRPLAREKGLALDCDVGDGISLEADRDGLVRVFVNLLDNAIKYTANGNITVTIRRPVQRMVEVSIADTGSGISAQDLPHIFERFYRVSKSRAARGSGLGLAIAAQIVHTHGGQIDASSVVGAGTVLTVRLPIRPGLESRVTRTPTATG